MKRGAIVLLLIAYCWEYCAWAETWPRVLAQWPGVPSATGGNLRIEGDTLYVGQGVVGLFDISDTARIRRVGTFGREYRVITPVDRFVFLQDARFDGGPLQLFDLADRGAPVAVSRMDGVSHEVCVAWPFVYVPTPNALKVYDFTNPQQPAEISGGAIAGRWMPIRVQNDVLVAQAWLGKTWIFDISNRSQPQQRGAIANLGIPTAVDLVGNRAFVCAGRTLSIVDVSDLDQPRELGVWTADQTARIYGMIAFDDVVWLAMGNQMTVLDVINPAAPAVISTLPEQGSSFARRGSEIFVGGIRIHVYDATIPAKPKSKAATFLLSDAYEAIASKDHYMYLLGYFGPTQVFDISNPERPWRTWDGLPSGLSLDVSGETLFLLDLDYNVRAYNLTDRARPVARTQLKLEEPTFELIANGSWVYAVSSNAVTALDFSDAQQLRVSDRLTIDAPPSRFHRMALSGTKLIDVLRFSSEFSVIDVTDPGHLHLMATVTNATTALDAAVSGDDVYLGGNNIVEIWDISKSSSPTLRGQFQRFGTAMTASGNHFFISDGESLEAFNISMPFAPVSEATAIGLKTVEKIRTMGDLVIVAAAQSGFFVVRMFDEVPVNPLLNVFDEGEMHRVRWSMFYPNHTLQSTPTPDGPWSDQWSIDPLDFNPLAPFVEVTFPNHGSRFYRLEKKN